MNNVKTFKEFIEESIWSDIQDRSSGDTIRKEDEVSYSTLEDEDCTVDLLYKYLIKNYEVLGDDKIVLTDEDVLHVPITLSGENIETEPDAMEETKIYSIDYTRKLNRYVKKMKTVIDIEDLDDSYDYIRAYTTSDDYMVCSKVVDFIEEILTMVPDPALRRRIIKSLHIYS